MPAQPAPDLMGAFAGALSHAAEEINTFEDLAETLAAESRRYIARPTPAGAANLEAAVQDLERFTIGYRRTKGIAERARVREQLRNARDVVSAG